MNGSTTDHHQAATSSEQSVGTDPRSKRNSGLFAFFKWFKPGSKESVEEDDDASSRSSSLDSVASDKSAGTVASFHYVPPNAYYENKSLQEKQVIIGPETDTYKARLKQRDKRREKDKNVTLRKKYNLFFNKETLLKSLTPHVVDEEENNSKSLPLMPKAHIAETDEQQKIHRRTNSESSKLKKAGAYVHVRGKRRAPQPPGLTTASGGESSSANGTLKRKKRLAPTPPTKVEITLLCDSGEEKDVLSNDSLILDHGVLKPVKEENRPKTPIENQPTLATTGIAEAPVSPRPWYKRNSTSKELTKDNNKYEPIERLPEVPFKRNSSLDLTLEDASNAEKDKKRKSGMSFLTNISELDREASEIMKNKSEYEKLRATKTSELYEIPEFMKPREVSNKPSSAANDSWVGAPKRRSARDLIAKFNAITNRTSVFGGSQKEKHFNKQISLDETRQRQEQLLKSHKKCIEDIDRKKEEKFLPLAKSESASAVKLENNKKSNKIDRRSWKCPKCNLDNEYWRIICHICSAIKPYFDDFSSSSSSSASSSNSTPSSSKVNREKPEIKIAGSPLIKKKEMLPQNSLFERSKTQIGFSALATYNQNKSEAVSGEEKSRGKVDDSSKKEEREKLKKMLIEMKNSLPKRKTNMLLKQNSRTSVILENAENNKEEINEVKEENPSSSSVTEKTQAEKVAEILIGTRETIYENIKVRKTEIPKPLKVSSSAQTSAVVRKLVPESSLKKLIENHKTNNSAYEPMKVQDFEDIYSDKNGSKTPARIYANLAQNDELSLFFNVPKNISNVKNNLASGAAAKNSTLFTGNNNADTLEINRLLRRLETAIAKGDMVEAAIFAKELAQLKVNCSVIRQKHHQDHQRKPKGIQIEMYVEDKVSHRGPFPIVVTETQTVAELKQQISRDFEIPVEVQKWILGKELVVNDNNNLKYHKITQGCPVFLYLVAPEKKTNNNDAKKIGESQSAESSNVQYRKNLTTTDEKSPSTQIVESNKNNKTDGAPKVVNVIPKSSEIIPEAKPEIVRIIPISKAIPTKIEEVPKANKISLSLIQPPSSSVTLTEMKVDIKPYTSRYSNNLKAEKPGLVRATSTKIEVFQCPSATSNSSKNSEPTIKPKGPNSNKSENNSANISSAFLGLKEIALSSTSSSLVSNKLIDDIPDVVEKPNLSVEFSNALKTAEGSKAKDWECHLCTLLNPDSSNICAVCATVRVIQKTTLKKSPKKKPAPQPQRDQTYLQLVNLDSTDLVPNADDFECKICFLDIPKGDGVTLRECLHEFCKDCLAQSVEFSDEAEVKCPYRDDDYSCNIVIQDREIKALVSREVYDQYLAKSVSQAENKMEKTFHCKTPDCKGWCIFEDNVNEFRCPVCRKTNCLTCQAIHMGANCKQYQQRMEDESDMNEDAKRTKDFLDEMVEKGEAIACPTCKVILMKKWGCDWLRCSMCKTEICWVTRGPRWGPAGKGDSSGGCKCGENGIKCHPKCNYCH